MRNSNAAQNATNEVKKVRVYSQVGTEFLKLIVTFNYIPLFRAPHASLPAVTSKFTPKCIRSNVIKIPSKGSPPVLKFGIFQNSAQMLSFFSPLHTQTAHFPSPYSLLFPPLYISTTLSLPEGRRGTVRSF
jgi:hypothetical protein